MKFCLSQFVVLLRNWPNWNLWPSGLGSNVIMSAYTHAYAAYHPKMLKCMHIKYDIANGCWKLQKKVIKVKISFIPLLVCTADDSQISNIYIKTIYSKDIKQVIFYVRDWDVMVEDARLYIYHSFSTRQSITIIF